MRRAAILLVLGACTLGPEFVEPDIQMPEGFTGGTPKGECFANLPWWEVFRDEKLKALIEQALENNKDLAIALERIAEARAAFGFVRADQFPSFRYSGDASRSDRGDQTPLGNFLGPQSNFALGADAYFEVDLWGRLRRSTEAAREELLARESAYMSVTITLVADVANTYLLLLGFDEQLEIVKRTLKARQDATKIIRDRFREGVVARLDVHQAEIEEATAEVGVSQLEREIAKAEHVLRVLIGSNPGRIDRAGTALEKQTVPDIPVGLPSELLERRPDIQVARHVAHAQTARVGVAEALRFPQLSLTGALGLNSNEIENFLKGSATYWSLGAGVSGPLFEFGKNARRVEVEASRARQSVLDYEQSVLVALQEVEDALISVRTYRREFEVRTRQVEAARGATKLARALYDEQFSSYLDVLDAERSLFDAELAQSRAQRDTLLAVVTLYKSLGGGWQPPEATSEPENPTDR